MITIILYSFWVMNYIWLEILLVPVTGQSTIGDGEPEVSNSLQKYLVAALVLLVILLLVCVAAIFGITLIYIKLSQIGKILSEKDDETYAQIGTNLAQFTQVRKDKDLTNTNGNVKGNNSVGQVEIDNEHDTEERSSRSSYLKSPDGTVQATPFKSANKAKLGMNSSKDSNANGFRGDSRLTENIPKYSSPPSYNNAIRNGSRNPATQMDKANGNHENLTHGELNNSQGNVLQQSTELRTFNHAANSGSVVTQINQKTAKKPKTEAGHLEANVPEHSSPDASIYAIYDVPRPCLCSSMCRGVVWHTSTFQHNTLKRSLSEIGPSAFELPLEMLQDNKYAVPRPVTFPNHVNYEADFKNLEKSSSKDSGVLSYVDSQLLDLIPEGNEPHLDSKSNLENKQRQVADKESTGDTSSFI
ncbi:uncharacterized protein LOC121277418 [Carcharodon carcharias]|uniref:uncharacterized protein LOC121277418 n=1 Tax=Carcharodon carcharias TaxID=13397 RepID=UPI001B7F6F5E|nr:uncharacterized protein LOC121277418 [Carcharodon carcharias]